ncbi:hypothetical protein FRC11_007438 [Ceratobasidium sp. 423]|nr:hypothetical protein FRC11_007438 [Ceratobasidium sp. 423]
MALVPVLDDAKSLKDTLAKMVGKDTAINDRTGIFTKIFATVPKIPAGSDLEQSMNDYLVKLLYETLPHPPSSYVGEDRFRRADGGRNNVNMPDLGRAGTAYARSVQGHHLQPPTYLPPPSMVFDELLKATGSRDLHPGGNSSLTFAFASLVTHSLFRTDPSDWGKNNTSSYLDLSPLYGSNQAEQDLVRAKDGRGLLHPDTFSEGRLVFLPPASAALLVMWNRNHNFIAENILKINEQKPDENWTNGIFNKLFTKESSELELSDFYEALGRLRSGNVDESLRVDPDPRKRNFGGIKRGPDGRFSDADVAGLLHNATENGARRYGARGVPEALRVIEIMSMEQARRWGVCTMNEFRTFLGLTTFKTFEEWNSDPVIASAARKLYHDIDNLELYPGLHAEECMDLGPGSGLCAGYTITRAILADAIALVRGDRFFTTDFTPERLTNWGFEDVKRDSNNGAFGAYLPKLLMRTFPRHYTYNSVYGLFPFFTPETTKQNLTKLEKADQYDFTRPSETPIPKPLNNFTAIKHVSNEVTKYKVPYGPDLRYITYARGMFLAFDQEPTHNNDRTMALHALYPSSDVVKGHANYYSKKIRELTGCKSYKFDNIPGTYVDILQVVNCASTQWAAENLCGITMEYEKNPYGEMKDTGQTRPSDAFHKALLTSGKPINDLVAIVLGILITSTVNFAQAVSQTIDFYMDGAREKEREHIIELASRNDAESTQLLIGYYREAARLNPQFPVLARIATTQDEIPQGTDQPSVSVEPGDRLFLSYRNAHLDPEFFPNPEAVDPHRPKENYGIQAVGVHGCPGLDTTEQFVAVILREIFKLKSIRRAPGVLGQLDGFDSDVLGTTVRSYIDDNGGISPWPTSLVVMYDA